jgi:hypothetical protein
MKLIRLLPVILLLAALSASASAQASDSGTAATVVIDHQARERLMGEHKLSLQWISWDRFGKVTVTDKNGLLTIAGTQKGGKASGVSPGEGHMADDNSTDDYLVIDGTITRVDTKEFTFRGTIVTKVSHLNGGMPCRREGEMTFRITGKRKYWRLKEMNNPCEAVVDYIDIFFR